MKLEIQDPAEKESRKVFPPVFPSRKQAKFQAGKTANVLKEMKMLDIDIVLWIEELHADNFRIYYTGKGTPQHRNGTVFIVSQQLVIALKHL